MHEAVRDFVRRIRAAKPDLFRLGRIIEFGSLDINGSFRQFCNPTVEEYIGLDWREGKGVDVVSLAHLYAGRPNGYFDFAVSCEMFEHDPFWARSLEKMVSLVRPGGALLVTCAADGRPPHELECAPTGQAGGAHHYEPLKPCRLAGHLLEISRFASIHVEDDRKGCDVRMFANGKLPC